ncbi:hypothetical protein SDC9_128076 [bioreactor metagenome]|uniref:Uncharacterized protein n=1 Tax=bioreactor metagenome TaxID=1076179 RepID=A0A645CVY2_9ZZZZ
MIAERFDGGDCHQVRDGEDGGKGAIPCDQVACGAVDCAHVREGARTGDQARIKWYAVAAQCVLVPLEAQLADGFVIFVIRKDRYLAVSKGNERIHGEARGLLIVNCHGAVGRSIQISECIGIGAKHAGDVDELQLPGGIIKPAAEKEDADELSLIGQLCADEQLVLRSIHVMQLQGVAAQRNLPLNHLDELCKEGVAHALDQQGDRIRCGANKVSRAGVRNVAQLRNGT